MPYTHWDGFIFRPSQRMLIWGEWGTAARTVRGDSRLLYISGLNGYEKDGTTMPESFEEQAELIWRHITTILASADMGLGNIVSLRTYLADPKYDEQTCD